MYLTLLFSKIEVLQNIGTGRKIYVLCIDVSAQKVMYLKDIAERVYIDIFYIKG